MAFRGTDRRRRLEDLFQAGAALAAGALLLKTSFLLQEGGAVPWAAPPLRTFSDLQYAAGLAAGCAGLLVLVWWSVGLAAALLSALLLRRGNHRAARAVGRFSPLFLKRLAAAALGVQLVSAPLPALAAPAAGPGPGAASISISRTTGPVPVSPAADPGWHPSNSAAGGSGTGNPKPNNAVSYPGTNRADPSWKPSPGPVDASLLVPGTRAPAPAATVTVRSGDTLWDLAAAQLGSLATDYEVARHWPAWHEANRTVIGPDPHRLLPGQVLAVPPPPAD